MKKLLDLAAISGILIVAFGPSASAQQQTPCDQCTTSYNACVRAAQPKVRDQQGGATAEQCQSSQSACLSRCQK